ncbi:MAG: acylphosphatase [Candidatus Diapherotrites archaeon]|nr:acylphosphatase [Candidatus Diapherotrites archaeon]
MLEGMVQGVGLRGYACAVARRMHVSGFVQNLSNGSVKIVAEGSREDLEAFLRELHQRFMISHSNVEWKPALHAFHSFGVRYHE